MRNISFAMTTAQIMDESKTVTRRLGWVNLKLGDMLRPVRKCMGLKPGEKIEPLRGPIRVIGIRREPLCKMTDDTDYGFAECALEGFADHPSYCWPSEFVSMFCASHKGCTPETIITRIEFEYLNGDTNG